MSIPASGLTAFHEANVYFGETDSWRSWEQATKSEPKSTTALRRPAFPGTRSRFVR